MVGSSNGGGLYNSPMRSYHGQTAAQQQLGNGHIMQGRGEGIDRPVIASRQKRKKGHQKDFFILSKANASDR